MPCCSLKVSRRFEDESLLSAGFKNMSIRKLAWKQAAHQFTLVLQPWRWRPLVPPKCRLTFLELHGVISLNIVLFSSLHLSSCLIPSNGSLENICFLVSGIKPSGTDSFSNSDETSLGSSLHDGIGYGLYDRSLNTDRAATSTSVNKDRLSAGLHWTWSNHCPRLYSVMHTRPRHRLWQSESSVRSDP
jgi:hypothetical protein